MFSESKICGHSKKFHNKNKHFFSQNLQKELVALSTNSDMRMELSNYKDIKEFLELIIIKWRLASDYLTLEQH
jgi:hypothetical protein